MVSNVSLDLAEAEIQKLVVAIDKSYDKLVVYRHKHLWEVCSLREGLMGSLDPINADLLSVTYELPSVLRGEVRSYEEPDFEPLVLRACEILAGFVISIIKLKKELSFVKIAVVHDLNPMGYLFDRRPKNYRFCRYILVEFIERLREFKHKLNPEELWFWNNSTVGGQVDGQTLLFANFLASALGRATSDNVFEELVRSKEGRCL